MSYRFDEDLMGWERGEITLSELAARHPRENVYGLAAVYLRLATAGSEPTPDPADGWGVVNARLLDPPRTLHRRGRWTTRPIMAAVLATLLTAGLALAFEPVRRGATRLFTGAAELLAQTGISNPLSRLIAPLRADPLRAHGYEDHVVEWVPSVTDGDRPTCVLVGGPAHGRAHVSPDCSHGTYIPDPNFNGNDSFWYAARDGARVSAAAQVQIVLQPVNDLPVAGDDDVFTDEDTWVVLDVLPNDRDVDDDPIAPSIGELPEGGTPPRPRALTIGAAVGAEGTVTVSGDGLDLVYRPPPNFNGTDEVLYTVLDRQGGSSSGTVTVTVRPVNDAPVVEGGFATGDEDTVIGWVPGATDVDGDALTCSIVDPPAHGEATVRTDCTGGTYAPEPDFHSGDAVAYAVTDGTVSVSAVATFRVAPVNDAPVAEGVSATGDEDTVIGWVPGTTDVDGDALTCSIVDPPAHGEATVRTDCTGGTYVPEPNYHGGDAFTYTVTDGTAKPARPAGVDVTILPVNDPPDARPDDVTTTQDVAVTFDALSNDVDVDGDPLTVTSIGPVGSGSAILNPDGTLTYVPHAGFVGIDRFTYSVSDLTGAMATGTVTVTVAPPPPPPPPAFGLLPWPVRTTTSTDGARLVASWEEPRPTHG